MTTASLDLCKELYELSGWRDDLEMWFEFGAHLGQPKKWGIGRSGEFPAYNLGYLLRKLPRDFILTNITDVGWQIVYGSASLQKANTPEDAATKLAIELFKQGVLKK